MQSFHICYVPGVDFIKKLKFFIVLQLWFLNVIKFDTHHVN